MQYAAEITQPTPEGTSNGLIQLFGQASVIFVYIMEAPEKSPMARSRRRCSLAVGLVDRQRLDHHANCNDPQPGAGRELTIQSGGSH